MSRGHRRTVLLAFGATLALGGALGCTASRPGAGGSAHPRGLATAPPAAQSASAPHAAAWDASLAGRKLFLRHCADCHGGDARGGPDAPSLVSAQVATATPGTLFWFLTNGNLRAGMPAWSRLPEARRWQLVAYLRTLSVAAAHPAPEADSEWTGARMNAGAESAP